MDKKEVLKIVKEKNIKFIRIWFTDVLGVLKNFAITSDELENALDEGMGFDGSSIEGFTRIQESDMIAKPDPDTFQILPWRSSQEVGVARMVADVINPSGEPFDGDPRYVLKRILSKAGSMGYTFYVGPELEYFYFKTDKNPDIIDNGGYFDVTPLDMAEDLRRQSIFYLQQMNVPVEYSHHEVAPSQHEIDLRYSEALSMADNVMTYKLIVKEVARQRGVYATFMPKPIFGINGSGMHVHQSLFKGNSNAFFNKSDKFHLSDVAKHYIAGILKYAKEIVLVTNQWINSYKRLIPGYEAPVYICWAQRNRSALIRVPEYKPGKEKATRIELRFPDPACNPYLAFAVMLAAGLKGVEEKLKLAEPAGNNIYQMSEEERHSLGIDSLPGDLHEAIEYAEKSKFLKETLGEHVFEFFIRNKKAEWDEYKAQVSEYEVKRYLPLL
ncbi:MAG: type I glutamate--ammonia ligase [Spirochaetes bacterium]|nr:type I glutamate--ammonia ligase [Spirochaetota bacterium]